MAQHPIPQATPVSGGPDRESSRASRDAELVIWVWQAREGKERAWDHLFRQFQLPLLVYTQELIGDRQTALDLVQETFTRSSRYLHQLHQPERFASWLFGIAHQQCLQHLRKKRLPTQPLEHDPSDNRPEQDPAGPEPDPAHLLIRQEEAGAALAALDQLPAAQRAAFVLHALEDFGLEEIAGILQVPIGTVKSRLFHARQTLRQRLRTR